MINVCAVAVAAAAAALQGASARHDWPYIHVIIESMVQLCGPKFREEKRL